LVGGISLTVAISASVRQKGISLLSGLVPDLQRYRGFDEEILLDTTESNRVYVLADENGSYIRLSESAYNLLRAVRAGVPFDELSGEVSRATGADITEEQLRQAYQKILEELTKIGERPAGARLPWGFWFRFKLLPEGVVWRVGSFLSRLYSPWIAAVLSIFILVTVCGTIYQGLRLQVRDPDILSGYLLFLLSLLFHEFGHASACVRYGARPSDIGFTLYLIYPAFYSDVTAAWQLKRWQRVVVDLGGCFFQLVSSGALLLIYWLSAWEPLRIAVLMNLYSCIFSLNPIFKFDGYWVLSDLLGVSNLGRQPLRIGKYLIRKMLGLRAEQIPWPLPIACILFVYSLISFCMWGYFLWMLFPAFWGRLVAFGHTFEVMMGKLVTGQQPAISEIRSLFISSLFLMIMTVMLWNVGKRLIYPWLRRGYSLFIKKFLGGGKSAPSSFQRY